MNTLHDIQFTSDTYAMTHVSDNRPVLEAIKQERQQGNNGWSRNRHYQKIGSIPALEYFKMCKINPDLRDPNKLEKWLMSAEGSGYRVAEDNPFRDCRIIVK